MNELPRAKQGVLPIPARSICGYCLAPLEAAGEVDGHTFYECPECSPTIKGVRSVGDWDSFAKDARRRRKKRKTIRPTGKASESVVAGS